MNWLIPGGTNRHEHLVMKVFSEQFEDKIFTNGK